MVIWENTNMKHIVPIFILVLYKNSTDYLLFFYAQILFAHDYLFLSSQISVLSVFDWQNRKLDVKNIKLYISD